MQGVLVLHEEEVDHQADHVARREVVARRLVRGFGEAADQLLEGQPHLHGGDAGGVEVEGCEPFGHLIEQLGLGEPIDLNGELEPLEDVAHLWRETLHVGLQVAAHVGCVAQQALQVHRRGVEEAVAGLALQEWLRVQPGFGAQLELGKHLGLGGREHAVEPAQHGEGQDNLAVVGRLVVAA